MVRAKLWDEYMQARFPKGTFDQIEAVPKLVRAGPTSFGKPSNGS